MNAEGRSCTRCILPDTYPGITFNEDGVCNYCQGYAPFHKSLGKEALLELLRSAGAKKGEYDCIVPISGGKDSTYILYYSVKVLGLRPVAVMHNSGYQHELAIANARRACRLLDVPLHEANTSGWIRRAMLKASLRVSAQINEFWHACGNCEAIIRTISARAARAYHTPFILWGSSALESGDAATYVAYKNLGVDSGHSYPVFVLKKILHVISKMRHESGYLKTVRSIIRAHLDPHAIRYSLLSILQRLNIGFPINYALRPHVVPPFDGLKVRFVHFFDYIEWDSINVIRTLEQELGWVHPEGRESRWDCALHCLGNYDCIMRTSVSIEGVNSCNFIREGKMKRDAALEKERDILDSISGECAALIGTLELKNFRMPIRPE